VWGEYNCASAYLIPDAGYFARLGIHVVGIQVGGELVDGMKFWNQPGELPKGILGTPYMELWDRTQEPPIKILTIYGYAPLEVWMNLVFIAMS